MFSNQRMVVYILIALGVLFVRESPMRGDAHQQTAQQVKLLFPLLKEQLPTIASITISDYDSSLVVESADEQSVYSGDSWLVQSKQHPVDRAKLMYLLDGLSQLQTVDVVSINASKHSVYGVTEKDGTRVQIYDSSGLLLADWIAGALRSQDIAGGDHPVFEYYMRRADSDEVFLSGVAVQPSADAIDWCDLNFLRGIQASQVDGVSRFDYQRKLSWKIERIKLQSPNEEEPRWQLTAPLETIIDNFSGDSLAFSCSQLKATDVVGFVSSVAADNVKYGFPQDRFEVIIEGSTLEFELGKPAREGHRYLRVAGLQHIYTMSDFEVGQLRQDIDSLYDSK
jgi:hypothetical protein